MAKAKTKTKPRKLRKPPTDRALINECVIYAQSIAAFHAGFKGDPDDNSEHAGSLGTKHTDRAQRALTKLATMKPTTPAGLQAMARIVPFIAQDNEGKFSERDGSNFILAFAANVKAFLEPIVNEHVVVRPTNEATQ